MKTTRVDTINTLLYSYKCQLSFFCSPSARQKSVWRLVWQPGGLFHPQLHQSQASLLSEHDQEFQISAERRKQRYLKVELAKTSTTFRHYIIINDVAWIWKLEFTERIQIPRFAGKISHMRSRMVPGSPQERLGTRACSW